MADRVLVADIGGTNTRIGLAEGGAVIDASVQRYRNADHETAAGVIASYCAKAAPGPLAGACVAIAGPVIAGHGRLTNRDWQLDTETLARACGVARAVVLNDLQAQGHALDSLGDGATALLSAREVARAESPPGPRLVIGIGTGFNAAVVHNLPAGGRLVPASECGHASLPVRSQAEAALARALADADGFCEIETALSGPGLARIDAALAAAPGTAHPARAAGPADAGPGPAAAAHPPWVGPGAPGTQGPAPPRPRGDAPRATGAGPSGAAPGGAGTPHPGTPRGDTPPPGTMHLGTPPPATTHPGTPPPGTTHPGTSPQGAPDPGTPHRGTPLPGAPGRDSAAILAACARGEPQARAAVDLFSGLLGAVTGDLALVHLPTGGIWLTGGMARAVAPHLDAAAFAAGFRGKGRFAPFMDRFSVRMIRDDYAALTGCAACLNAQG